MGEEVGRSCTQSPADTGRVGAIYRCLAKLLISSKNMNVREHHEILARLQKYLGLTRNRVSTTMF